jgi:hypothetical protein
MSWLICLPENIAIGDIPIHNLLFKNLLNRWQDCERTLVEEVLSELHSEAFT